MTICYNIYSKGDDEMTHTKWTVGRRTSFHKQNYTPITCDISDEFTVQTDVAWVICDEDVPLVAAAPKMLKALEAVRGWYFNDTPIQSEMIDLVTEAIQEAIA